MADNRMKQDNAGAAGIPLRRVETLVLVFYLVLLPLNIVHLHRSVEHLPYGPVRSFWVTVTGPLAKVAESAGFARLRTFVATRVGEPLNRN